MGLIKWAGSVNPHMPVIVRIAGEAERNERAAGLIARVTALEPDAVERERWLRELHQIERENSRVQQLVARQLGTINQFYLGARQAYLAGQVAQQQVSRDYGDMRLTYTNNQGQEQVLIQPRGEVRLPDPPPHFPMQWLVLEFIHYDDSERVPYLRLIVKNNGEYTIPAGTIELVGGEPWNALGATGTAGRSGGLGVDPTLGEFLGGRFELGWYSTAHPVMQRWADLSYPSSGVWPPNSVITPGSGVQASTFGVTGSLYPQPGGGFGAGNPSEVGTGRHLGLTIPDWAFDPALLIKRGGLVDGEPWYEGGPFQPGFPRYKGSRSVNPRFVYVQHEFLAGKLRGQVVGTDPSLGDWDDWRSVIGTRNPEHFAWPVWHERTYVGEPVTTATRAEYGVVFGGSVPDETLQCSVTAFDLQAYAAAYGPIIKIRVSGFMRSARAQAFTHFAPRGPDVDATMPTVANSLPELMEFMYGAAISGPEGSFTSANRNYDTWVDNPIPVGPGTCEIRATVMTKLPDGVNGLTYRWYHDVLPAFEQTKVLAFRTVSDRQTVQNSASPPSNPPYGEIFGTLTYDILKNQLSWLPDE